MDGRRCDLWKRGRAAIAAVALLTAVTPGQQDVQFVPPRLSLEAAEWLRGPPIEAIDRWRLLLPTRAHSETMWNAAAFLAELQRRYRDKGLRVALLVSGPLDEPTLARLDAGVAVARQAQQAHWDRAHLIDGERVVWSGPLSSGITTWIETALAGKAIPAEVFEAQNLQLEMLGEIEDHELDALEQMAKVLLDSNPVNPDGWSLRLIAAVERQADFAKARQITADALAKLGRDSAALGRFAEKLLRTIQDDRAILEQLLMALLSVAPAEPNALPLQFEYLRVLSALGRKRDAELLAARLHGLVQERPAARGEFAAALAFGALAERFADIARPTIDDALRQSPQDPLLRMIRYNVLARCCKDAEAARAQADRLIGSASSINDEAWYMMTREPGRGRFNHLAMAFCDKLIADGNLSAAEMDTIGLALFLDGRVGDAITMQERAVASSGEQANYVRRLARFRRVAELRALQDQVPQRTRQR